jgi:hypothetical protein
MRRSSLSDPESAIARAGAGRGSGIGADTGDSATAAFGLSFSSSESSFAQRRPLCCFRDAILASDSKCADEVDFGPSPASLFPSLSAQKQLTIQFKTTKHASNEARRRSTQ